MGDGKRSDANVVPIVHTADVHLDSPLQSLALRNAELAQLIGNATRQSRRLSIGQGLYARATTLPFDGRLIPTKGVSQPMKEALGRVGVQTKPTKMQLDYNARPTTQLPTGRVTGVNKRVRSKIGYNGCTAKFERV